MTDIVERLRYPVGVHPEELQKWCIEAAIENERLRAALQTIASNKLESRATLEAIARRALEPKP